MGDPLASLRWLACRLGPHGIHFSRGHVVVTGSSVPLCRLAPGDSVIIEAPPLALRRDRTVNR
jgi:2-keto-4-pentenoate hydratase